MTRCVFWFKDTDIILNLDAEEFHEDGEYIKAYKHHELVGMFLTENIKAAYRTEKNSG